NAPNTALNLWVMNADGSGATPLSRLTAPFPETFGPVWSPDGSKIAFVSDRALDGSDASILSRNIWSVRPDGTGLRALTRYTSAGRVFAQNASWSPDSTQLVFDTDGALDGSDAILFSTNNIWRVNADGTGAMPLTQYVGKEAQEPAWSPDGTRIAFDSTGAGDGLNIWVINPDGSGATELTNISPNSPRAFVGFEQPVWSGVGSRLAFLSGVQNVWVMNGDGTSSARLTNFTVGLTLSPRWRQ